MGYFLSKTSEATLIVSCAMKTAEFLHDLCAKNEVYPRDSERFAEMIRDENSNKDIRDLYKTPSTQTKTEIQINCRKKH